MQLYSGIEGELTERQLLFREYDDEQLKLANLGADLDIKLDLLSEFSFRYFASYSKLSDEEIREKCKSEEQLEKSLAFRVATFKELI